MPAYTRTLQKDEGLERKDLITSYFSQGLTGAEIVGFLVLRHGIVCSVRTLKRILKRLGLKRAGQNNESLKEHIVGAILEELENSVMWLLRGLSSIDKATET